MRIILDSNEYILGLDTAAGPSASSSQKYRQKVRLKHADALIAAFAEFMKVDYIVSENRHLYRHLKTRRFATLTAQDFLDLIEE